MAAAEGNDYSKKSNRLWGETLRRIAAQDPQKLRRIAEALYARAEEGDIQAVKEIGDRLDGKPGQEMDITHRGGLAEVLGAIGRSKADDPPVA